MTNSFAHLSLTPLIGYIVGDTEPAEDCIMDDLQEDDCDFGLSASDARSVPATFSIDGEETSGPGNENILVVPINGQWYLDITQN